MIRVVRMQNRINWIESFDDAFCLCRIHPKTPTSTIRMHFVDVCWLSLLLKFSLRRLPNQVMCVAGDCLNRPRSNTIICSTSFCLKFNNNISRQFDNDDDIQLLYLFASSIDHFLSIVHFISLLSRNICTKLLDWPLFTKFKIHFRWFVRTTSIVSNSCLISCTFAHKIIRCQTPFVADNFQFVYEQQKRQKIPPIYHLIYSCSFVGQNVRQKRFVFAVVDINWQH